MASKLVFSYVKDEVIHLKTREIISIIFRPKIPIRLLDKSRKLSPSIDCLLDSGADRNLFPAQFGRVYLGLTIESGIPTKHYGIGNAEIYAFQHAVEIMVGGYKFSTKIDFAEKQQIPLLGRTGFFKLFKEVRFNEFEKLVSLVL